MHYYAKDSSNWWRKEFDPKCCQIILWKNTELVQKAPETLRKVNPTILYQNIPGSSKKMLQKPNVSKNVANPLCTLLLQWRYC